VAFVSRRLSVISFDAPRAFTARAKKRTAVAACGLLAASALVGCSAGQVSQTATQEPAVNGTLTTFDNIALRNIHLQAVQTSDALKPGEEVDLIFTATNLSPDVADRLVSVTSEVGEVTVTGKKDLPPNGVLVVGEPDGATALGSVEAADVAEATVTLEKPISNGLLYNFTFTFEKAGSQEVAVPISAGEAPRQAAPLS
jgi:hypothetical protein